LDNLAATHAERTSSSASLFNSMHSGQRPRQSGNRHFAPGTVMLSRHWTLNRGARIARGVRRKGGRLDSMSRPTRRWKRCVAR